MIKSMEAMRDLFEGGVDAPWELRSSARARRLALRVSLDGRVQVVVPRGVSGEMVRDFVTRHRAWVERKLAERRSIVAALPAAASEFPPREIDLPAFGERWRIERVTGTARARLAVDPGGLLTLRGASATPSVQQLLSRWLIERARRGFESRLSALVTEFDFPKVTLQVRRQRTRWGSCSRRGVVSLNVCGVFQRPEVLRYLMLHELVHTQHMNHSPQFWQKVEAVCQDWRALDRELSRGWRQVPPWVFAR